MTILACGQPNFFPWLGYFHKMAKADIFVLLDDVQVPRCRVNYARSTKIRVGDAAKWLTWPIIRGVPNATYRETFFDNTSCLSVTGLLWYGYQYAAHWPTYERRLDQILGRFPDARVAGANTDAILWAARELDIQIPVTLQSEIGVEARKANLPVALCQEMGADTYLSGEGAREYNDPTKFREAGIKLAYQEFTHPIYKQRADGSFLLFLSVLDLLLNCGPTAGRILGVNGD